MMSDRVEELRSFEQELSDQLGKMKMQKEHFIVTRDRKRVLVLGHQGRLDTVEKELLRVKMEKGKLIDTDVWVAGVMQRCVTKELRRHLRGEIVIATNTRDGVLVELGGIRAQTFIIMENMAKVRTLYPETHLPIIILLYHISYIS
jgi:hypothetical protein